MSIAKNTSYNLMGAIVPLILALATIPLYLDIVGPQRYGALAIAWLILGYFGLFDLGLGRATAQRIAALKSGSAAERSDIFWTAVVVNVAMGMVGGVILYFAAHYFFANLFNIDERLRPEVIAAVPILAAAVPVATLTGVASGALQGREKFLEVNLVTIAATSLFQLIPLAVAWAFGPTLKWLILAAVAARIIGLLIFMARVRRNLLVGIKPRFDKTQWAGLLKYGGWVSVTSAIGPLLVVSDRFVIGAVMSAVAVTIYTIPFEIAQRMSLLPRSLGMALFPRMASSDIAQGSRISNRAVSILVITMTPPIILALFALQPFLTIWVGQDMAAKSAPVGWVIIAGFWINAFAIIPYSRLQAIGRPDLVSKAMLLQLPLYICSMYFALLEFGLVGAALIFSLRCLVDYVILSWLSAKRIVASWIMLLFAAMICVNILALINTSSFSASWWGALILSGIIVGLVTLRNLPAEFEKFCEKLLPNILMRQLRFK